MESVVPAMRDAAPAAAGRPRAATWEDLIRRFAEFTAMPCLRASGPDRRRPDKERLIARLRKQYASIADHLPDSPSDLTPAHWENVLRSRGLSSRGGSRRPSRRAFWDGLWRAIILDRDDYRCYFCGRSALEGVEVPGEGRLALRMELDHLTPRSAGGEDYTLSNIRAVCRTCNTARGRMKDEHFRAELRSIAEALGHTGPRQRASQPDPRHYQPNDVLAPHTERL